uniref:Pleckstrin homology domain-containing family M member 2 n=1 Tax=Geotrypetes seraphini TaxID=260995 RepID=A0A6P8PA80_GEOSA|nr:pleckstrin homology domain-containing family M member 2 isoform X2 [Geotrypetes seraphini]
MEPGEVKDRILENLSLSVKKLQSYFAACEDETPAIRNHDKVLQRLCEHLDHALLYGLQDISSGYWVLVVHFTRREAIHQIELLQNVATHLGRSRAWLYLALNENSLESYLRLFQENQSLLHKFYYKNSLVCSHDHLTLFLTLVSGLEFIRFELDLDGPYLDVAPYMPEYYKPQYLLDFEDRLPNSVHGSDNLSLNSFNSITSTNLEWDDSAIAPSSEDGDLPDTTGYPRSVAPDLSCTRTAMKSPTQRYNPFNEEKAEAVSSVETTPVHSMPQERAEVMVESMDQAESCLELEVIRMGKKKKTVKKKKRRSEEEANHASPSGKEPEVQSRDLNESGGPRSSQDPCDEQHRAAGGDAVRLRLPEMKDLSMESVGQPLSKVINRLNGQIDPKHWNSHSDPPDQPFRTCSLGETPDGQPYGDFSQGISAPMDFYRFTLESPNTPSAGSGYHDTSSDGQPPHVFSCPETASQAEEEGGSGEDETARPVEDRVEGTREQVATSLQEASHALQKDQASSSVSSAEDSGVEEGQGSPSEAMHPCAFRVDNNHLLLLMIHVFRENEEQLFKMLRMSTGHMEGNLQLLFVLLTDCYIYLLRKGATDKPYMVEEAISYSELDYISIGLDQQTVTLVCMNRRRQFLLDSADVALTEFFVAALKSAMVKGYREPPYPWILSDATMEKLALAKFVAQESKCESADVVTHFFGLVHWEDPLDQTMGLGCTSTSLELPITKEGVLHYKASTSYLGKEYWKPCFVVLSNGILYQYPDRMDVTPLLSINMGGEQCGGCRRSNTTERPHSFQVILTDRPSLELSAGDEEEMADWMQYLCQAVSKGVIPQGVAPIPCLPCCLVITEDKAFTCHEDCQTSFFRLLGSVELADIVSISTETAKEYCVLEFAQDRKQFLPSWFLYFSCITELERFLTALNTVWKKMYQVDLLHKLIEESSVKKKCEDALDLIHSTWQRSDSLQRGRSPRDPWC